MERTDIEIRENVEAELRWDPRVHDSERIGVAVKDGVAMLSGNLGTYEEKWAAERAAERVIGVAAVVNELVVRPTNSHERTDEDIAQAAVNSLRWRTSVPDEHVKIVVDKGWVTLEGKVEKPYQRDAAEQTIRFLTGVRGVTNLVTLTPAISETVVKADIEAALKRIAEVDARNITVHANGHTVTLTGEVRSAAERRAAEQATWAAAGVRAVENQISVGK